MDKFKECLKLRGFEMEALNNSKNAPKTFPFTHEKYKNDTMISKIDIIDDLLAMGNLYFEMGNYKIAKKFYETAKILFNDLKIENIGKFEEIEANIFKTDLKLKTLGDLYGILKIEREKLLNNPLRGDYKPSEAITVLLLAQLLERFSELKPAENVYRHYKKVLLRYNTHRANVNFLKA